MNTMERIKIQITSILGAVVGAIIAPMLGFAFSGYHNFGVYLDYEKGGFVVLIFIGIFLGAILGTVYARWNHKLDKEDEKEDREKKE